MAKEAELKLLIKALSFAADKHRNQRRKNVDAFPYINHPISLVNILCNEVHITDINLICSALLHDTVEDTETTEEELTAHFGKEISGIVMEVTDDQSITVRQKRKQLQIRTLPSGHVNPFYLSDLFRILTECVTSDAVAGETVTLSIVQVGQRIICDLYPLGVDPRDLLGSPGDDSPDDRRVDGLGSLPSEVADEVHRACRHVASWGGTLRVCCSDDFRISVRVTIKAVESQHDDEGMTVRRASNLGNQWEDAAGHAGGHEGAAQ